MATANSITVAALDLISDALKEIGALAPGEQPSTDDEPDVLRKLQRVIDSLNAKRQMIYTTSFTVFNLGVQNNPYLIGPGATFDVNQRPVEIPSISLILSQSTGGTVELPLMPRDNDWWAMQQIKNLQSTLPTDYYYSPDWPNGSIYFWPVPTAVNQVRVELRAVITELTSYAQHFTMPPGYWDAVVYSLAEAISPMYERPVSPDLLRLKTQAIRDVEANNIKSPRLASDSPTQPGKSRARPDFNFLTGLTQ